MRGLSSKSCTSYNFALRPSTNFRNVIQDAAHVRLLYASRKSVEKSPEGWMLEAPWLMVLGVGLVYSFFVGFDSSVYTTAVTELADPRSLGSALALHSFLGFGAGMISPIVFGIIQDATGPAHGWGWGFATGGVAAVGAVAAMLVLRSMPESKSMANGKR